MAKLSLYIQSYVVASESIGADGSSTLLPHTVRIAVWGSGCTLGTPGLSRIGLRLDLATAGGQIVLRASIEERPLRRLPMRDLRCLQWRTPLSLLLKEMLGCLAAGSRITPTNC